MPTPRKPTPRKAAFKTVDLPTLKFESDRRIPLIVLAVIAALMAIVLVFTQCKGPATTAPDDAQPVSSEEVAPEAEEIEPVEPPTNPSARASLAEYSWEELSEISAKIAKATSSSDVTYIARQYNLVDDTGALDGAATKTVSLADGTTAQVRIIGFNHDSASDGSGKAGITFMFADGVTSMAFNEDGSNTGGWPASSASYYLGVQLYNLLPQDLASAIVEVKKKTQADSGTTVVETGDIIWLPSYIELTGQVDPELQNALSTLQQEGSQYQLFADAGVSASGNNSLLVMHDGSQASAWWLRSIDTNSDNTFYYVNAAGHPTNGGDASSDYLMVPCFSV